eukprot:m.43684 g.43684  ORF g.43684 m.43684 type:complete len:642 (+) comp7123_c1_seq3:213-2138(+)
MGNTGTKNGVPTAWGATVSRGQGRKSKKEYSKAQLQKLDKYLKAQRVKISKHIQQLQQSQSWGDEYGALQNVGRSASTSVGCREENKTKNRYTNILPYDHSRVKITPSTRTFHSDYVNASYINGYKKQNAYIASQGPVPDSFADFWQMIWEEGSNLIVMVTNEVEGNKLKCHRYWPEPTEVGEYGNIQVENMGEQASITHIKRDFMLVNLETTKRYKVTHLQFILWPDHGVPKSAKEILTFRDEIYRVCDISSSEGPLVIHCSAGVGRTGTYMALDRLIGMAESLEPSLDVQEIVRDMRESRCFMIQTLVQYGFVYICLLEALTKGHKEVQNALAAISKMDAEEAVAQKVEDLNVEIEEAHEELSGYADKDVDAGMEDLKQKAGGVDDTGDLKRQSTVAGRMSVIMDTQPVEEEEEKWAPVSDRMKSLEERKKDEFREQLKKAESVWIGDEYMASEQLTPIESRKASLAAQREAFSLRGELYRKQVRDASLEQIQALQARVQNLQDSVSEIERKRQATLSVEEQQLVSKLPLRQRIGALRESNAKGSSYGRVIVTEEEIAEKKRIEEEKKALKRQKLEDARIKKEKEEEEIQRKKEAEKNKEPERDTHEDIVKDTEQSWVNLKSREQKKSVHPMIAALQNK